MLTFKQFKSQTIFEMEAYKILRGIKNHKGNDDRKVALNLDLDEIKNKFIVEPLFSKFFVFSW